MRGAAVDLPPVQHPLHKQPCGPRPKHVEMGAADYSRQSETASKIEHK